MAVIRPSPIFAGFSGMMGGPNASTSYSTGKGGNIVTRLPQKTGNAASKSPRFKFFQAARLYLDEAWKSLPDVYTIAWRRYAHTGPKRHLSGLDYFQGVNKYRLMSGYLALPLPPDTHQGLHWTINAGEYTVPLYGPITKMVWAYGCFAPPFNIDCYTFNYIPPPHDILKPFTCLQEFFMNPGAGLTYISAWAHGPGKIIGPKPHYNVADESSFFEVVHKAGSYNFIFPSDPCCEVESVSVDAIGYPTTEWLDFHHPRRPQFLNVYFKVSDFDCPTDCDTWLDEVCLVVPLPYAPHGEYPLLRDVAGSGSCVWKDTASGYRIYCFDEHWHLHYTDEGTTADYIGGLACNPNSQTGWYIRDEVTQPEGAPNPPARMMVHPHSCDEPLEPVPAVCPGVPPLNIGYHIQSYSDSFFTTCVQCENSAARTWDGNFIHRAGCLWHVTVPVSMHGKKMEGPWSRITLHANVKWEITIFCRGEPYMRLVWRGFKTSGPTPAGRYSRSSGCDTHPYLLILEGP